MALADYRLCDVCGDRTFYDANLNYEFPNRDGSWPIDGDAIPPVRGESYKLGYLGDWAVLCVDCAKTHQCVIEPRNNPAVKEDAK